MYALFQGIYSRRMNCYGHRCCHQKHTENPSYIITAFDAVLTHRQLTFGLPTGTGRTVNWRVIVLVWCNGSKCIVHVP